MIPNVAIVSAPDPRFKSRYEIRHHGTTVGYVYQKFDRSFSGAWSWMAQPTERFGSRLMTRREAIEHLFADGLEMPL